MKMLVNDKTSSMFKEVVVEHEDLPSLVFSYRSRYYCGDSSKDLFESVNEYLGTLSKETQLSLYELFKTALKIISPSTFGVANVRCREDIENNLDYNYLVNNVKPIIDQIFDLLNVRNYVYNIRVAGLNAPPPELKDTIKRGEYFTEMTINPDEYSDIAEFALLIRPIYPILAQMMTKVEKITGADYKGVVTMKLINTNPIVINHPGYIKVVSYIKTFYNRNAVNLLTLSVISGDSYSEHSIATAVINRLCCAHIPSMSPPKNLAKVLFSVAKQFDGNNNNVREKPLNAKDENDNKRSLQEIYQVKEEVNSADIKKHTSYFTIGFYDEMDRPNLVDRFKIPCAGLKINNPELVDKVYELIPKSWDYELSQPVMQLLQLTFLNDVSYNLYPYMSYEELMSTLALASVKLEQLGFPNLSQLVLSKYNPLGELSDTNTIFNLNDEERDFLLESCFLFDTKENISTNNELVTCVNGFLSEVGSKAWHSVIEPGMISRREHLDNASTGYLFDVELCREIKTELIALIKITN